MAVELVVVNAGKYFKSNPGSWFKVCVEAPAFADPPVESWGAGKAIAATTQAASKKNEKEFMAI